jgi:hypothetical protein
LFKHTVTIAGHTYRHKGPNAFSHVVLASNPSDRESAGVWCWARTEAEAKAQSRYARLAFRDVSIHAVSREEV